MALGEIIIEALSFGVGSKITYVIEDLFLFQNLSEKLSEQEMQYKRLTQEQLDNFTLDINTAYARLRGIEQAFESEYEKEHVASIKPGMLFS